jgi:hypothetical protein
MALNSLRGANNVEDSNPARVKAREEVQNLYYIVRKCVTHKKWCEVVCRASDSSPPFLGGGRELNFCLCYNICEFWLLQACRRQYGYSSHFCLNLLVLFTSENTVTRTSNNA